MRRNSLCRCRFLISLRMNGLVLFGYIYIYFLSILSVFHLIIPEIDQPFSFSFSKVLFFSSWTGTAHPSSSSPSLSIFPLLQFPSFISSVSHLHLYPASQHALLAGAPNRQRVYWCELCSSPKHPSRALLPVFLFLTIGTSFNNPPNQPDPKDPNA